jgi:hypothetical protein
MLLFSSRRLLAALVLFSLAGNAALACLTDADCGSADNTQPGLCQSGVCQCGIGYAGSNAVDPTACSLVCSPPPVPDSVTFLNEPNVTLTASAGNLVMNVAFAPYLYQIPTTMAFLNPSNGSACPLMPQALGLAQWAQSVDSSQCAQQYQYSAPFGASVGQACWQPLASTVETGAQYSITFSEFKTQIEVIESGLAPFGQAARQTQMTPITRAFRRDYTLAVATGLTVTSQEFTTFAAPVGPTAVADTASTNQTAAVAISVLDNDIAGSNPLANATLSILTAATQGSTSISNGVVTYQPTGFFYGSDSFVYQICDTIALCGNATVSITVVPLPPLAVADSASVSYNSAVTIDVLSNDIAGPAGLVALTITTAPAANMGTASVTADNKILFTAANYFAGPTATFTYQICDASIPTALCSSAVVTVNVLTSQPTSTNTSVTVPQNGSVNIPLSSGFSAGSAPLNVSSVVVTDGPSHGTATVDANGNVVYTPETGYYGPDSITIKVCDEAGFCVSSVVSITVTPNGPKAYDDTTSTGYRAVTSINVLNNDVAGAQPLQPASLTFSAPATGGSLSYDGAGTFIFTPAQGFYGAYIFTYQICDNSHPAALCSNATVTISVGAPTCLQAANDVLQTSQGTAASINVLANDNIGSEALASITLGTPAHGTVSTNALTGIVQYTPTGFYYGSDVFSYTITDDIGCSSTANVTVTVTSSPPVCVDYSARFDLIAPARFGSIVMDVLSNNQFYGSGISTMTITTAPTAAMGTATVLANNSISFTSADGFVGVATLQYQVCDNSVPQPLCCSSTVSINVGGFGPQCANNAVTLRQNDPATTIDVLGNDVAGIAAINVSSLVIASAASNGTAQVVNGNIVYTANTGYYGSDALTYSFCDSASPTPFCVTCSVSITITAFGPTAVADVASTGYATAVTVDALANDLAGAQPLQRASVTFNASAAGATVSYTAANGFLITPDSAFYGDYVFPYTVCDNSTPLALCSTATVTVSVSAPSDIVLVNDTLTTNQTQAATINVLTNDNLGPEALASLTTSTPAHGTVTVSGLTGSVTYTPTGFYHGSDSFTYTVTDAIGRSATATVSVTVLPLPPVAVPDFASVNYSAAVTIDVLSNDVAGPAGLVTLTISEAPTAAMGTASVTADNKILFTAANYFAGPTATFKYQICDASIPTALCSTAVVTVSVDTVGPTANDVTATVPQNSNVTINVLASNVPGSAPLNASTVSITSGPSHGTASVDANGNIVYTPETGYYGPDQLVYRVCDEAGLCASANVTITVTPVGPTANADTASTKYMTPVTIAVLANDVAGAQPINASTLSIAVLPSNGDATVNANGTITYTPTQGFVGSDSFTYQVCDNSHPQPICSMATVTVVVAGNGVTVLYRLVKIDYNVIGKQIIATVLTQIPAGAQLTNTSLWAGIGGSTGIAPIVSITTGVACDPASPAGFCDQYHVIRFSDVPCQVSGANLVLAVTLQCANGNTNPGLCGFVNYRNTYRLNNIILTYDSCPRIVEFGINSANSFLRLNTDAARAEPVAAPVVQGSTLFGRCSITPSIGAQFQSTTLLSLRLMQKATSGDDLDLNNTLGLPYMTMLSPLTSNSPSNPIWDFDMVLDPAVFLITETYYLSASIQLTFANTGVVARRRVIIPLEPGKPQLRAAFERQNTNGASTQTGVLSNQFNMFAATVQGNNNGAAGSSTSSGTSAAGGATSAAGSTTSAGGSSNIGMIAGIAAGVAVAVIAGIVIVALLVRRRKNREHTSFDAPIKSTALVESDLN